jgi:NADH dehydrogenase
MKDAKEESIRRMDRQQSNERHRVVIVGGGFGGLWAAKALRRAEVDLTLVDRRNHHLFQPLLYQVAAGGLSPADIASPLRGILASQDNCTVLQGEMVGIDYDRQEVLLKDSRLTYDSLIVACGTRNHFFGNDQWPKHARGLKSIEDALETRNRLFSAFEAAEKETDPERRRVLLTIVIIGGGPTGVELAGAVGEITRHTLKHNFRSIEPADTRIILLEGGPRILRTFPAELARAAERFLGRLGVDVRVDSRLADLDSSGVEVTAGEKGYRINSHTVIWAAGVRPSPVAALLVEQDETKLDRAGRIIVNPDLSLPGRDNVFVIGDMASFSPRGGEPLPGVAPVAMSQGRYVARLIRNRLKGREIGGYRYRRKGDLAVIGRAAAVADFGWARFSGYPAWWIWLFVHLMYLVEFENRLVVFVQWAWSYFTRNQGARLITDDVDPEP